MSQTLQARGEYSYFKRLYSWQAIGCIHAKVLIIFSITIHISSCRDTMESHWFLIMQNIYVAINMAASYEMIISFD